MTTATATKPIAKKPAAKKAPPPPLAPTIVHPYLMWVGSESYPGMVDWSDEAIAMGISKRLPNADVGRALMREGTVVFVAHDEGETHDCGECRGPIECPDCRKRAVERWMLESACDVVKARYVSPEAAATGDYDGWEVTAPPGDLRFVAVRMEKADKLNAADATCTICDGKAEVEAGTGGYVVLSDGSKWDYRRYNYWLHQPTKWDPGCVVEKGMCLHCGGTGEMPNARVFGVFVPERVEYIMDGTEAKEDLEKVADLHNIPPALLKVEEKRRCGFRHKGVYVVTTPDGATSKAKHALDELVEKGLIKPEATEVHGSFVRFTDPLAVAEKRFRGVKAIDLSILTAAALDEAEMIVDALKAEA